MKLVKSILAGIMIGVGCNIFISCENKYIGSLLFSLGLVTILLFDFSLYTGNVCYIPEKGFKFIKQVLIILLGNIIGCFCFGLVFPSDLASVICQNKLQINLVSIFFRAVLCNILIYIAVDSYKTKNTLIPTFLCIPVFILSGYEHSIADIVYFVMAGNFSLQAALFILIVILGNAVGGMFIPLCNRLDKK